MGFRRWLLGPLVCLLVGAAGADRPPECQPAPLWSIGHRQPLVEARGKQASSLESLRKHFSTYGMSDLRFLIVNNHLQHSVAEKGKLDARVTFPVYQDTEERAIWDRMRGGKDDVFIYDRCGRLAYFIPFPLSIMNTEDALVPTAILATYFQSPCGATCDDTFPSATPFQEFGNETTEAATTLDLTTPLYSEYAPQNSSSEEVSNNSTLSDFDYPSSFNDSLEDDETDVFGRRNDDNNDLSFVLDRNETSVDDLNGTRVDDPLVGFSYNNRSNEFPMFVGSMSNETDGENVTVVTTTTTTEAPRKKSDRCAEADMSVCRTWSKRKLLRAQTCCNNGVHSAALSESCRNYGKKRCKKIRTVLKCCLKTSFSEDKPNGHASPDDVKSEGHASKVNSIPDDAKTGGHASHDDVKAKVNTFPDDVKVGSHASHDDVKAKVKTFPDDVKTGGHASHDDIKAKVNTFPDDFKTGSHASHDDVKIGDHASHDDAMTTSADDVTIEVTTTVNYVACCKEEGDQRTCRLSLEGVCEADETLSQEGPRLQTN